MKTMYDILQSPTGWNSNKLWIQLIFVCQCIAYEHQILQDCCFFQRQTYFQRSDLFMHELVCEEPLQLLYELEHHLGS
jgi:hypothetical protein